MSVVGQFQFRCDPAALWAQNNPILRKGEMGIEDDTDLFKIGNGVSRWNALPYGGLIGARGFDGDDGWSPFFANVADGERRVLRLIGYTGGTGTPPAVPTNNYLGPTGLTNLAGATDVRGATGQTGPAAFTTLTASFTQPALDGEVTVTVGNTAGFAIGQTIFIELAGYYAIIDILSATSMVLANLTDILPQGQTIPAGSKVTAAGVAGPEGLTGPQGPPGPGKPPMTLTVANATTNVETVVARWAIPANTIEANDGIQIRVKHQSAGNATVIWRLRCGAAGTTADTLLSQNTTSAAQAANAQGQWQGSVFFPATNQARGGGFAIQQAVVLGQTTAAQATATINPAAVVFVSVTVQLSAAQASQTTAAVASWGDQ